MSLEERVSAFLKIVRKAPVQRKSDFILRYARDKNVLDLGVVAHTIGHAKGQTSVSWLHSELHRHASRLVGVDILADEVAELNRLGYTVRCCNVLEMNLDEKFDVIVCGDLVEHVDNVGQLLKNIKLHLREKGVLILTTPNPFAISRTFNLLFDRYTAINYEHTCWYCPQTLFQTLDRSGLQVVDFSWIDTDYPMLTRHRMFGPFVNALGRMVARRVRLLSNDFAVVCSSR